MKQAHIHMRIDQELKDRLERAAKSLGLSLTAYLISTALKELNK